MTQEGSPVRSEQKGQKRRYLLCKTSLSSNLEKIACEHSRGRWTIQNAKVFHIFKMKIIQTECIPEYECKFQC